MTSLGIISDTHGLLRPEAVKVLQGSAAIFHAGDIGKLEILTALEEIAPVFAVRGNNDLDGWAKRIPKRRCEEWNGRRIFMIHNIREIEIDPAKQNCDIVIFGHSHKPTIEKRNGVLFLNPGSAGPRRFNLPVTLAKIEFRSKREQATIVKLL